MLSTLRLAKGAVRITDQAEIAEWLALGFVGKLILDTLQVVAGNILPSPNDTVMVQRPSGPIAGHVATSRILAIDVKDA